MEEECVTMCRYLTFLCKDEFCASYDEDVENGAQIWSDILELIYRPYDND